mmetsp:Transcript_3248/g.9550  ORF Transcript_3248/g.9550 Transcript_3248/m.9550 type:complete len:496 (-) Transcript_3248:2-1489(-)
MTTCARRLAALSVLACAATLKAPAPRDEPFDATARLADVAALDAWLWRLADGPAPPPEHWLVRGPGDLKASASVELTKSNGARLSNQKSVNASRLHDGRRVIVKNLRASAGVIDFVEGQKEFAKRTEEFAARADGRFHLNLHGSKIAYYELLYLVYLRGLPGVPLFHGGWWDSGHLVWVSGFGGEIVGEASSSQFAKLKLGHKYDDYARRDPLGLAAAWLRCFRSFAELGGFVLTDFKPPQFVLDLHLGRAVPLEVMLVDGPAINTGPLAQTVQTMFDRWHAKFNETIEPLDQYYRPGQRNVTCEATPTADASGPCARRTYAKHACVPSCCHVGKQHIVDSFVWSYDGVTCGAIAELGRREPARVEAACAAPGARAKCVLSCGGCKRKNLRSAGAPELSACAAGACAPFDGKVHVFDAAGKAYILPRIIERAEDHEARGFLRSLLPRMLAPDPRDRPSFSELLDDLARFENGTRNAYWSTLTPPGAALIADGARS